MRIALHAVPYPTACPPQAWGTVLMFLDQSETFDVEVNKFTSV